MLPTQAFAEPYVGGYTSQTVVKATQIFGYNNFAGTSTSSLTSWVASVLSTGGWNDNAEPTGWSYQSGIQLLSSSPYNIKGAYNVWELFTLREDCASTGQCQQLGTFSNIAYVYQTFWWNVSGGSTKVKWYYEPHYTDGSSQSFTSTYTKLSTDPTKYFSAGIKIITAPQDNSNRKIKFLQFGAETGVNTSGWKVKQYDMGYVALSGGVTYLKNLSAYSTTRIDTDKTNNSYITYKPQGST
ncbi:MAG: hypothetical protein QXU32_03225 [Nitrososphaerales archaeon]